MRKKGDGHDTQTDSYQGHCRYNGKCYLNLKPPEPPKSGKNVNNHVPFERRQYWAWKKPNVELTYLDNTA